MRKYSVTAIFNASTKGYEKGVDRAIRATKGLRESTASFAKQSLSTAAGIAIFDSLQKAANGLGDTLKESVKYYDTMTSFANGLKVLGVSTTDIQKTQGKLNSELKGTGVEATSATGAISALVSSGMKIDKATDTAIAFSKGMALTGTSAEGAEGFMRQYAQGIAKGKFELEDFNTMNENAPGILDQVAKSLLGAEGNSRKLYDAMQKGEISVDEMNSAVTKLGKNKWDEAIKNQTLTVGQGLTEVKKSALEMGATFIGKVNDIIKQTTGLNGVGDVFMEVSKVIDKFTAKLKNMTPQEMVGALQSAGTAVLGFGGVCASFVAADYFSKMTTGVIGMEKNLATNYTKMAGTLQKFGKTLDNATLAQRVRILEVSDSLQKAHPRFREGMRKYEETVGRLSPAFSKAFGTAKATVSAGSTGLTALFNASLKAIAPAIVVGTLLAGMGAAYSQYQTQIDQFIQTSIQKGPQIIGNLAQSISQKLPSLISSGVQMLGKIVEGINANLPALLQGAVQIISALVDGLVQNAPALVQQAISLVGTLAQGIAENLPTIIVKGAELVTALATAIVQNLPKIFETGAKAVGALIQGIGEALPKLVMAGAKMLVSLLDGVMSKIPGVNKVWDKIKGNIDAKNKEIESKEKQHSNNLTETYRKTAENASAASEKAKGAQTKSSSAAKKGVVSDYTKMASDAKSAMNSMTSGVNLSSKAQTKEVSKNADAMTKSVTRSYASMARDTKRSTSEMSTAFSKGFGTMGSNVDKSMKSLQTNYNNAMKSIANNNTSYLRKITTDFKNCMNNLNSANSSGMNKLRSVTSSNLSKLSSIYKQQLTNCVNVVRSYYNQMYNVGAYITIGLNNGIVSKAPTVYANVNRMAANIERTMRKAMDIHSPSRVFRALGGYISEGLAIGITDNEDKAIASTQALARATSDNFAANFSGAQSFTESKTLNVGEQNQTLRVQLNVGGRTWGEFVQEVSRSQGFASELGTNFSL